LEDRGYDARDRVSSQGESFTVTCENQARGAQETLPWHRVSMIKKRLIY
jgi:hypothetical protein